MESKFPVFPLIAFSLMCLIPGILMFFVSGLVLYTQILFFTKADKVMGEVVTGITPHQTIHTVTQGWGHHDTNRIESIHRREKILSKTESTVYPNEVLYKVKHEDFRSAIDLLNGDKFPLGAKIEVHYNPENPAQAKYFFMSDFVKTLLMGLLGLVLSASGVWILIYKVWRVRSP